MNLKQFFTKNWIHFAAIAVMVIMTVGYFSLQFDGYGLKQHDIEQFKGASHEIVDYRERTGEEIIWTNSMFGGMPGIQISMIYSGNFVKYLLIDCFIEAVPSPAGVVLLYMIGFYILVLCLRINPWVGLLGAIAFGFTCHDIIILQAGHNSKGLAIALMAPVIGAFLMAYQRNMKWGIILSALFMTLQMGMNHLQITYYLGMLLFGLGLVMIVEAIRKKNYKKFLITTGGLLGAYAIALFINYGNISLTNDYARYSIRGANDISIEPDGSSNQANATDGLDKDYVTQYSNGIGESFTMISPYIKGSAPGAFGSTHFAESFVDPVTGEIANSDLSPKEMEDVMNSSPSYWGDQPMVSGPVYIGIIVFFLAILGMVFLKSPVKWAIFGVTLLMLALSWGENFMGLTNFFLDHVPGYNKFRAPTIIMAVIELCIPLLGVFFLHKLVKEREQLKAKKKTFLIASAATLLVLIIMRVAGMGDGYTSKMEKEQMADMEGNLRKQVLAMTPEEMKQYGIDASNQQQVNDFIQLNARSGEKRFDNVKEIRKSIYNSSMNRSILFLILGVGAVALLFYTALPYELVIVGLTALISLDLIPVARNYLGSQEDRNGYKYWDLKANTTYPISEGPADLQILESEVAANPALASVVNAGAKEGQRKADELGYSGAERRRVESAYKYAALNRNTNYRVFDLGGGFNSAHSSYFHKALGGYHGAKLRSIQNVFDFHLSKMNNKVYDMLNVKYFIQQDNQGISSARPNETALGNAWFIREIQTFETPNNEILALGSQFALKNAGVGTLLVNDEPKKESNVYGSENIRYVLQGDTMDVRLQNGMPEGLSAYYVMDVNGKTNWVMAQSLAADTANSFLRLVEVKVTDEFKPQTEAVMLKSEAGKVSSRKFSGIGSIKMTSYAPNKITYKSSSTEKQFAVFSEIYYPEGWTATIDGKEAQIIKTDYLLRGLEIPAGDHKIEFVFRLPKFDKSNTYASIGGVIIILLILAGLVSDIMKKRKEKQKAA